MNFFSIPGFSRTRDRKLTGAVNEVWTHIPHPQGCAKKCKESTNFACRGFSYSPRDQTCILSAQLKGQGRARLKKIRGSDYYELESKKAKTSPICKDDEFRCDSGACVSKELLCNGANDCGDMSDEKNCTDFALRLIGGPEAHRGLVEVGLFC